MAKVVTMQEHRCAPCERMFKTAQALASHERHRHFEDTACPICYGGVGSACWWHFL